VSIADLAEALGDALRERLLAMGDQVPAQQRRLVLGEL
jgi:hypothetical protein